jgi:hypothetical protein
MVKDFNAQKLIMTRVTEEGKSKNHIEYDFYVKKNVTNYRRSYSLQEFLQERSFGCCPCRIIRFFGAGATLAQPGEWFLQCISEIMCRSKGRRKAAPRDWQMVWNCKVDLTL